MAAPPPQGLPPQGVAPSAPNTQSPPVGAENTQYAAQTVVPYVFSPGITHFVDATAATSHTFSANCPVGGALVLLVYTTTSHAVSTIKDNFGSVYSATSVKSQSDGNAACSIYYCSSLLGTNPAITITLASSGAALAFALPVVGANPQFFLDGSGFHLKVASETTSFPPVYSRSPGDIFISAYSGNPAPSSNPAGFTVESFTTPSAITGDTNIAIGWSNAPVVANTKGPVWGNAGGNPSGSMTIAIRAAGVNPSQPSVIPPALLPGLPQGPFAPAPPVYAETLVPVSGPSTTAVAALGLTGTEGTAALTGAGALAAIGSTGEAGLASLTGSGALSALGVTGESGTAFADPGMQAVGETGTAGTASLSGSGALAALGLSGTAGTANLIGSGALAALALTGTSGTADLEPQSPNALSALGISGTFGAAQLTGSGVLASLGLTGTSGKGNLQNFVPGGASLHEVNLGFLIRLGGRVGGN